MTDSFFAAQPGRSTWRSRLLLALAAAFALSPAARASTTSFDDLLTPLVQPSVRDQMPTLSPSITASLRDQLAKGASELAKGQTAAAVETARAVTVAAPDAAEGWHLLGLALANENQMDAAIDALGKAASLYAKNAQPLIAQGEILASLGRTDEALAAFKAATDRDPTDWRGFESLATLQARSGDLVGAKTNFQTALSLAPAGQNFSRLQLARIALAANDGVGATALLKPVTDSADAPDAALDLLAAAQVQTGDTTGAMATYNTLIARGTDLRAFIGLGRMQVTAGDFDAAEAILKRAVAAFPNQPAAYFELGNLFGARERYREALDTYSAGLLKAPGDAGLLKGASIAEMRLGNLPDALAKARGLADRPGAGSADYAWLASLQETTGDAAGAIQSYGTAVERDPKNWLALNNLSSLLVDSDPQRALSLAKQAAALAPNVTAVRDTEAWALYKTGDAAGATEAYKKLAADQPNDPVTLYRLGVVEIAAGKADDGRASVKAALAADPAFKYADQARAILGLD